MITNKIEAFHHNSCKKIAQLSKVIFAMNCLKQDQDDVKIKLFDQFEDLINDINEKHIEELNNILQFLFKYRKTRINKYCGEFGSSYKILKKDFIDYFNEQTNKFVNILNNIKEAQEEVKAYQVSSLQVAAVFFEKSDQIANDLTKLKKTKLSPTIIKKSISPIFQKMDCYIKEWNIHYNEIKENHIYNKANLEKESSIIIQQELKKYCSIWEDFLLKLSPIKAELSNSKKEYTSISDRHSSFFLSQYNLRSQIVNETAQSLQALDEQKNVLIQSLREYSSNHLLSIQLLEKNHQNYIITYNQNYAKLQQEIHHMKHLRHQFKKSYSSRGEQLQFKLNESKNLLNQQFLTSRNSLLEFQANNRKYILLGLKDLEHLLSTLSSLIKKWLDNERYNVSRMLLKIQQMQINQNSICEGLKNSYQTIINQSNEKFQNCLQKILSLNEFQLKESEKVENLRALLNSSQIEMNQKIMSFNNKYQTEYQNAIDNYQNLIKIKQEKLNTKFSQKVERKTNIFNQTKKNFSVDIADLLSTIKTNNDKVINDEKNECKMNLFRFIESQNNQSELNKINGRLEYYNQSVLQAKQIAEKTVRQLDHEISSVDKKIRQFKRFVKSTIQNIDDDYEMKIQVMQIDLNNKIESLSKIFSKDENDRGCEIIESIRKIREIENQKLNKSLFLIRERSSMIRQLNEQIEEKKKTIFDLKNNKKENEIIEKVNSMKSNLAFLIENESNKLSAEKNQIIQEIEKVKIQNLNNLKSIENEVLNEKSQFDSKIDEMLNEKNQILNNSKSEIEKSNEEFEKSVKDIKLRHQKEIDSLKRRIDFAKKIQSEVILKQKNEIDEKRKKCQAEIDLMKSAKNEKFLKKDENCLNELFDNKFDQLLSHQLNLYQPFLLKVEESQIIQSKRLRLEFLAVKKTDDLSKEFSMHFQNLTNSSQKDSHSNLIDKKISFNFNNSKALEPNENKDESNGDIRNILFKKISQNIECHSSANISESGSHKKIPILVTPRLAA